MRIISRSPWGGCAALLALLFVLCADCLAQSPRIEARPNPVPGRSDKGRTQVSWDTGDGSPGQVYVAVDGGAEVLFAGGASGSQPANWISTGSTYEFRLYRGTERAELLGRVRVVRGGGGRKARTVIWLVALAVLLPAGYFGYRTGRRRLEANPEARRLLSKIPPLDASVGSALYAFTLTRLIVLVTFLLTVNLTFEGPHAPGDTREPYITVASRADVREVGWLALNNDAGWYAGIARNGYERQAFNTERQHNWAFFPLHPLIWRYASRLTGEQPFTGMALSNLFFLVALVLLYRLVREFGYDGAVADRTVFYVAAFPSSYFFSLPWTESLFLCLAVGCVYAAKRDAWWLAGAVGALSTATRVSGVYLLPVLLILYVQKHGLRVRANALGLLLIPTGLLAFSLYLYLITGNPLAFKDILVTWGRRSGFFLGPLLDYLAHPSEVGEPWNFRLLNFTVGVVALGCVADLLRRREWALACLALVSILTPLSTTTLTSLARYTAVNFPVHLALARFGGRPRVDQTIRALFLAALALMSGLFAAGVTLAGA